MQLLVSVESAFRISGVLPSGVHFIHANYNYLLRTKWAIQPFLDRLFNVVRRRMCPKMAPTLTLQLYMWRVSCYI